MTKYETKMYYHPYSIMFHTSYPLFWVQWQGSIVGNISKKDIIKLKAIVRKFILTGCVIKK